MYLVRGRLDPEVGAMLMRAVEAASDALFRASSSEDSEGSEDSEDIEPKQRRADAVGLLAERALAAGFGGGEGSGTRAERYQVVLHVEASTLESEREGEAAAESEPGRSELEDGTRVSAETSRRLSCDASVVWLTHASGGELLDGSVQNGSIHYGSILDRPVLDVGRKTRTIPPALRRVLEARDRGCRFPGCGLRFTDAHHVRHWADGGETKLENLVLLCRFHHRLVHEEGFTVHFPRGERPYFLDPRMRLLPDVPPPPPPLPTPPAATRSQLLPPEVGEALGPLEPAEALMHQNRLRGVEPGSLTSAARYKREDDIPLAVIRRALHALDRPALEESALEESALEESALDGSALEESAPAGMVPVS